MRAFVVDEIARVSEHFEATLVAARVRLLARVRAFVSDEIVQPRERLCATLVVATRTASRLCACVCAQPYDLTEHTLWCIPGGRTRTASCPCACVCA